MIPELIVQNREMDKLCNIWWYQIANHSVWSINVFPHFDCFLMDEFCRPFNQNCIDSHKIEDPNIYFGKWLPNVSGLKIQNINQEGGYQPVFHILLNEHNYFWTHHFPNALSYISERSKHLFKLSFTHNLEILPNP